MFGRCIITDGCKGRLHQVKVKPDHVIGQLTPDVAGLNNWVPRKILYDHNQPLSSSTWKIKHNLNNQPSVQTYVYLTEDDYLNGVLTEVTPELTTVIDANTLTVMFTTPMRGVAQCIARSTSTGDVIVTTEAVAITLTQISMTAGAKQYITIATLDSSSSEFDMEMQFLSPTTFEPIADLLTITFSEQPFGQPGELTPWFGALKILISGKSYTLRTAEIDPVGIPTGSSFYFLNVPERRDTFIMLTKAPYTSFDRILDNVIDMNDINETNATSAALYTDNQLFLSDALFEPIYPNIRFI